MVYSYEVMVKGCCTVTVFLSGQCSSNSNRGKRMARQIRSLPLRLSIRGAAWNQIQHSALFSMLEYEQYVPSRYMSLTLFGDQLLGLVHPGGAM